MGICESIARAGGRAVSGEDIVGSVYVRAICSVIEEHQRSVSEERVDKKELGLSDLKSEFFTAQSSFVIKDHEIASPAALDAVREPVSEHTPRETKKVDIEVTEYAPKVFRFLRSVEGIPENYFINEWTLPEEKIKLVEGEGRSQALFLKSNNQDFMCKTISAVEVDVLLSILQAYANYLAVHPDSLIMRFLMLLKVTVGKSSGFVLIFGDVFATCAALNEKWDIKGRHPKPGKYKFFPVASSAAIEAGRQDEMLGTPAMHTTFSFSNRKTAMSKKKDLSLSNSSPDSPPVVNKTPPPEKKEEKQEAAEDTDGKKSKHVRTPSGQTNTIFTEHTGTFGEETSEKNEPLSPDSKKLRVRKDKELSRCFWLSQQDREAFMKQLLMDFDFLLDCGLMDYSLLVGVEYVDECSGSPMHMTFSMDEWETGAAKEKRGKAAQHISSCRYHQGLHSINQEERYFIAIIDMLTTYNYKKKMANCFKSFLWEEKTLSTIPPENYKLRIQNFAENLFPYVRVKNNPGIQLSLPKKRNSETYEVLHR